MTQALARQQNNQGLAAVPDGPNKLARLNMRELKEVAQVFIDSGTFTDVKQVAQAMVKIMAGAELGFSPIVSMTGVHFFNGKVSIGANLIASLIKDGGKYEYKITEHTDKICTIQFFQKISSIKDNGLVTELKSLGVAVSYTWADAAQAKLTGKDNWQKYPKDMLFAAAIRQGARRYCADILRGITPETETENEIDRTAMDGQEPETAAPSESSEPVTIDGEIVDTETGEIIEEPAPQPANPPAQQNTVSTKNAEPVTPSDDPKELTEMRTAIAELLNVKVSEDQAEQAAYLKGRDPAVMTLDALKRLQGDLAAM